jgi:hypothetical protein
MITDLIIGIIHAILDGLVILAPEMPERPAGLDGILHVMSAIDYLLPISEWWDFFPVMLSVYGAMALWRGIRLLLPGG